MHKRTMRIGYGYKRAESDFAGANVDRAWIDHAGTERMERSAMLDTGGVRAGDTLVLLAQGDLGRGGELPMLRRYIEGLGVVIEISEHTPKKMKAPVGRRSKFQIPEGTEGDVETLWHGLQWSGKYVLGRIREITEFSGDDRALRNALIYRFGKREKINNAE